MALRRLQGSLSTPSGLPANWQPIPLEQLVGPTTVRRPVNTAARVPTTGYVLGTDVAKIPGFNNPTNPLDTGRAGERNEGEARARGFSQANSLAGWDYDLGRPINANARLNKEGYYELGMPGAGGAGASGTSTDPILQKIRALSQQQLSNARANAAQLKKQAAIETGDEKIAQEIGLDANTVEATKANPFSRRANFLNEALRAETELETGLNQDNLFYSGHRVNELANLGRKRAEGETTIGNDLRSQLALIDQNLAAAEYQAQLEELEAQRQAMLEALMYGGYGGGGDGYYEEEYEDVPIGWTTPGEGLSSPAFGAGLQALYNQQQAKKNPVRMILA